jgi:hypothetical protein
MAHDDPWYFALLTPEQQAQARRDPWEPFVAPESGYSDLEWLGMLGAIFGASVPHAEIPRRREDHPHDGD